MLGDYHIRLGTYRAERDALEADFQQGAAAAEAGPPGERTAFSARCFAEADEATRRWTAQVRAAKPRRRNAFWYDLAWRGFNRQAGLPVE